MHNNSKSKPVTINGRAVMLTPHECGILEWLMSHPNQYVDADDLYRNVWQEEPFHARAIVHVHICHLRKKIDSDFFSPTLIEWMPGKGYRFNRISDEK